MSRAAGPVVVVPGELELDERLAGPVTLRMAGWLAVAAAGVALAGRSRQDPAALVAGAVLVALGGVGAFVRPAGRSLAGWLGPVTGYLRRTRPPGRPLRPRPVADGSGDAAAAGPAGRLARQLLTGGRLRAACLLALLGMAAFAAGAATSAAPSAPATAPPAVPVPPPADLPGTGCGC